MNACNTPRKVYELMQDQITYEIEGGGLNTAHCNQLYPIPLTSDILVKNGFELGEKIGEVGVHIYRHTVYKMDDFSLEVYSDNTFHFASIKLNYVHQLQHLLRLCGIEKELTI